MNRVAVEAPIENEVAEMREFGLRYAVLINPRFYGWDNSYISYSLHRYPKLFVAHGLLNPAEPDLAGRLRFRALSLFFALCSGGLLQPLVEKVFRGAGRTSLLRGLIC